MTKSPILPMKLHLTRVATPLGFEPRITPPKGAVLPLHHGVNRLADLRFSTAQRKLQLAQGKTLQQLERESQRIFILVMEAASSAHKCLGHDEACPSTAPTWQIIRSVL